MQPSAIPLLRSLTRRFPALRRLAAALAGFALLQTVAVPEVHAHTCSGMGADIATGGAMDMGRGEMSDHAGVPFAPAPDAKCQGCGETDDPASSSTACTPDCASLAGCAWVFTGSSGAGCLMPGSLEGRIAYARHALSRSAAPELPPPRV